MTNIEKGLIACIQTIDKEGIKVTAIILAGSDFDSFRAQVDGNKSYPATSIGSIMIQGSKNWVEIIRGK